MPLKKSAVISRAQLQAPKKRLEWIVESFDGLNNNDDPAGIGEGESPDTLNTIYDNVGAIQTRKGYTKLLTTSLANPITGMFAAYKDDGVTKQIIYGSGTNLYRYNNAGGSTALTNSVGTVINFTNNQQWYFDIYLNKVFCANGVDGLYQYDFTNLSAVSTAAATPQLVKVHKNRLWMVNPNSSTVYFSDAGSVTSFPANNFISINTQDGQVITGVEVLLDSLIIFKTDSIWIITGEPEGTGNTTVLGNLNLRKANSDVGCVAPRTIARVGATLLFMARSGIYVYQNAQTQLISQSINNTFRSMNTTFQNLSWGLYSAFEKKYTVGFPSGASTTPDQIIMYDLITHKFAIWDDYPGSCAINFRFTNTDQALMGDVGRGIIYNLFTGYADIAGDNGTVSSATTTTITDSTKSWTTNQFKDCRVQIIAGTGSGQSAIISSNTGTQITFSPALTIAADTSSVYTIGGYNAYWKSKIFDFEEPGMTKKYKYWNIFTDSENNYNLKVGLSLDYGSLSYNQPDVSLATGSFFWDEAATNWDQAGVVWDTVSSLYKQVNVGGQARFIQVIFGQNKANQPWRVFRYSFSYKEKKARAV